jgi:AcrR family transcriptional regulator
MSLIGTLGEIPLADVLRLLASGRKSGRLTVTDEDHQAVLRFQKGALVQANNGRRLQGEDAVLDLFGWRSGQMNFVPEERAATPNVQRELDDLIDEGLRTGESFHRMQEVIPSDRVIVQLGPGPKQASETVTADAWRALRLADGVRDLRELAEILRMTRGELARLVFGLLEAGLLEKVDPWKSLRALSAGLTALFGKDSVEVDERVGGEWRRLLRFGGGVARVEIRTAGGKSLTAAASFRSGLNLDVILARAMFSELGVKEGEDVQVRPLG